MNGGRNVPAGKKGGGGGGALRETEEVGLYWQEKGDGELRDACQGGKGSRGQGEWFDGSLQRLVTCVHLGGGRAGKRGVTGHDWIRLGKRERNPKGKN